ncbi:MAG: hypothetical protein HFF84_12320 [Oscillibacter sp.]|nr:hypothetical protein [Oscillibacter sp.]
MPAKPKIWAKEDIPTPVEMAEYLARIQAARDAFRSITDFPPLPPSLDGLSFETANHLEQVLSQVQETITNMRESRVYSGELQTGGI